MMSQTATDTFTAWARDAEPRIRAALTASFGPQLGAEATADALAIAWRRWDDVADKPNPVGYVFGIGRNLARRSSRSRRPQFVDVPASLTPLVEPGLPAAIAKLSEHQRVVATLVHGYGWTLSETAELLGTKKTTVQNHLERAMKRLRDELGVER